MDGFRLKKDGTPRKPPKQPGWSRPRVEKPAKPPNAGKGLAAAENARLLPAIPTANQRGEAAARLDQLGLDWLIDQVLMGRSMRQIGVAAGVAHSAIHRWLEGDAGRDASVRAARERAALGFVERGEQMMLDASDKFALDKAVALAHHWRWKAKVQAPRDFGDRVQVDQTIVDQRTPEQRAAELSDFLRSICDDAEDA